MPDVFVAKNIVKKEKPPLNQENPVMKPAATSSIERLPGHTHNPFASFSYYPEKVNFETKEEAEKIVLFLRQHPIVNLKWILIASVLVAAPSILLGINSNFLPGNFRFMAILAWYLITCGYIFENFLSWFFNVYIVTDERIVDVDFANLIYKEVSDANIDKIQDVTYKMGGVARTFFNYGDVTIQTASEVPNFDFLAVPNPDRVVKVLQELRREEEQEKLEGRIR